MASFRLFAPTIEEYANQVEADKTIDAGNSFRGILYEIGKMLEAFKELIKEELCWFPRLCNHFKISLNSYYNYLKGNKNEYYAQREVIFDKIKYIFYNKTIGHRTMRVFLSRYGIYLSKFTVHKYMNKMLNLASIIMRKKLEYKSGHKHKIL